MILNKTIAVLDANVLYAAPVRDLLLSFAHAGLFQPKWTRTIQQEWVRNLLDKRSDLNTKAIYRLVDVMNMAFPDAEVSHYKSIVERIELPDPDDRHVLAAAIRARAKYIVSFNVRDFPQKYLANLGVRIIHPDDFVKMLILNSPVIALNAFDAMLARLKDPPLSRKQVVSILEKSGFRISAKLLA